MLGRGAVLYLAKYAASPGGLRSNLEKAWRPERRAVEVDYSPDR